MVLGLLDPDPSIIKQKLKNNKKNLDSYCFFTSLWLLSLINDVNVPSKYNKQKNFLKKDYFLVSLRSLTKIAESGYISQGHGYADPDPFLNATDRNTADKDPSLEMFPLSYLCFT